MEVWEKATEDINERAPMDASTCWHTSRLWIRAEAEKAIVDSTLTTLMVSIGCGFAGTFAFTHFDMMLSGFVVLSVTGVTCCLAFFMCVMMAWPFGAVEVLGLIVFVGYSITYSLHIAHKYGEHTKDSENMHSIYTRRYKAVRYALDQMSGAVTGSAITTLGSSFFLFFCAMAIFVKLAAVLFAVTFFAGLFALVAMPAALLVAGPVGFCGCGGIRSWIRSESFDYDVEENAGRDRELPSPMGGQGSSGSSGSGGFDARSSGGVGGFDARSGGGVGGLPESTPESNHATSMNIVKSEVFAGMHTSAQRGMVTPNSSPGIRSLVAGAAGPPGPPMILSQSWGGPTAYGSRPGQRAE